MNSDDGTLVIRGDVVLREERLFAETERVVSHVASIERDVATREVARPVSLLVESLHLQRRATHPSATYDVAPIVEAQRLVVQITRESAVVGKRVVLREEIGVRRRKAREIQRFSEAVRRERLAIDSVDE